MDPKILILGINSLALKKFHSVEKYIYIYQGVDFKVDFGKIEYFTYKSFLSVKQVAVVSRKKLLSSESRVNILFWT